MKKLFVIAAALVTLAACNKNNPVEIPNLAGDNAIGFSAYTASPVTKGTVVEVTDVYTAGIGVFAFYQPAVGGAASNFNSKKYATPDFMYNQQVTTSDDGANWTYSPIKYWPNNENDQLSFFAYAPYDGVTTWEDLGFSTDVNGTKLTASFPVYNEKPAMVDYVFAKPQINLTKKKVADAPINFEFKHIMSRIAINVAATINDVPEGGIKPFPQVTDGTGTLITVESIKITGIAESYDYTLTDEGKFEAKGTQDLVLTTDDFENNTSAAWDGTDWKPILAKEEGKAGYLFIAPQAKDKSNLVITYTVATTDKANPANNSTVTNVIEKPIEIAFEAGKAYALNLLIGMRTVDLSASVVDWVAGTPETTEIDVPANE